MNAERRVLALVKIAQSATIGTRKARCHQVKRAWLRSTKASVDRLTRSRSLMVWCRSRANRAGLFTRGILRFMVFSSYVRVGEPPNFTGLMGGRWPAYPDLKETWKNSDASFTEPKKICKIVLFVIEADANRAISS